MNMTPEQQTQWLDAAQALLDGEHIEYQEKSGSWQPAFSVSPNAPHRRRAPRMVPLTRGDVPPGSVFHAPLGDVFMPVRISDSGVYFMLDEGREWRAWAELVNYGWRILRPGDTEWRRCEKEEAKP